ncbi:MAG: hypothetical protein ACFFCD_08570 [Promethearchaeota archaeon]
MWTDDFSDSIIDSNRWGTYVELPNTLVEENGYIRMTEVQDATAAAFFNFQDPITGPFDISFKHRFNALEGEVCTFLNDPPRTAESAKDYDGICTTAEGEFRLRIVGESDVILKKGININTWYTFRIKRIGSVHTIYIDGEKVWEGGLYDSNHINMQFGDSYTALSKVGYTSDYDEFRVESS